MDPHVRGPHLGRPREADEVAKRASLLRKGVRDGVGGAGCRGGVSGRGVGGQYVLTPGGGLAADHVHCEAEGSVGVFTDLLGGEL